MRGKTYDTQNADNFSQSNTYKTFYHSLAFVRSGDISINVGVVNGVGDRLYGWSGSAVSNTNAYGMGINLTDVYLSNSSARRLGFPLRCLYPGSA